MVTTSSRIYGLDILRAYAILAVVTNHGQSLLPENNWLRAIIDLLTSDGVSVFFVLSGFLIGSILIKTIDGKTFTGKELWNFWIRRWFRTLPAYFLILFVLILLTLYTTGNIGSIPLFNFITFTQNFAYPYPLNFFKESWSLSVEEWFYLLIPFTLFLSFKFTSIEKKKVMLFWICTIIIGVTLLRIYKAYTANYTFYNDWDLNLRKVVVTRLDSIMYGFLGAYLNYYCRIKLSATTKTILFIAGLIILLISNPDYFPILLHMGIQDVFRTYFQVSTACLGTLMLFPVLLSLKTGKGIVYKILTFISLVSYSLYLVHNSLIKNFIMPFASELAGGLSLWSYYAAYYILSILFAFVLYNYYEHPITKLRDVVADRNLSLG